MVQVQHILVVLPPQLATPAHTIILPTMEPNQLLEALTNAGDLVGIFGPGGEGVIHHCGGNVPMWCNYHSYIVHALAHDESEL